MSSDSNLEVIRSYFACATTEAAGQYLSEDALFFDVPNGHTYVGRAAVVAYLSEHHGGAFTRAASGLNNLVADESCAVAEFTFHGTNTGKYMDHPATGRTVTLPVTACYTISDGVITGARIYYDMGMMAGQLGWKNDDGYDHERDSRRKAKAYRFVDQVLNLGDLDSVGEYLTEDYVDHDPMPGQEAGINGFKQTMNMLREGFPDITFTTTNVLVDGDKVCLSGIWSGTHSGNFMGFPATGCSISVQATDIVRLRDDKAAEHWGNVDMLGLLQQLGIIPVMQATPQMSSTKA